MSIAARAVWTIERNLGSDLSLGEIADACQVSKFHLCRAFEARTGMPVMHYVRARRLSDAAAALAGGADDILALALDAGYGSHEAFTRAFGAQFDRTPEAVRKQKSTEGLNMMTAGKIVDDKFDDATIAHRFEAADAMTVVGLSELQSFARPETIPGQWQRFMSEFYASIDHKADEIPISVTTGMADGGAFEYLCGVEVSRVDDTPPGLIVKKIPARRYIVFRHDQHVSMIGRTYAAIWDRLLPEAGATVVDAPWLEKHLPTFNPRSGLGGIEIWIPVD